MTATLAVALALQALPGLLLAPTLASSALLLCVASQLPALFLSADAIPRDRDNRMWLMIAITPGGVRRSSILKAAASFVASVLLSIGIVLALVVLGLVPWGAGGSILLLWLSGLVLMTGLGALVGSLVTTRLSASGTCAALSLLFISAIDTTLGASLEALNLGLLVQMNPFSALVPGTIAGLAGWGVQMAPMLLSVGLVLSFLAPHAAARRRVER